MSRANSRGRSHQDGQVLVLLAFGLVALIAILALVIDGGAIYLNRRRMQNAADAGVLAGTRVAALNGTNPAAIAAATDYTVTRNGADTASVSANARTLTVLACENVPMSFARLLGRMSTTVCAKAGALWGPISQAANMAPIAIKEFPYLFNTPYVIWDDSSERDPLTGYISGSYRGWLNLECVYPADCGAAGSDQLKHDMIYGSNALTHVNTWIRGDSGVKAAVIQQAHVGQILYIVVYDQIESKYANKTYYHAVKFAAFKVTQVYATGNPKGIRGEFQYYVTAGPPGDGDDGGWRVIDLTQ